MHRSYGGSRPHLEGHSLGAATCGGVEASPCGGASASRTTGSGKRRSRSARTTPSRGRDGERRTGDRFSWTPLTDTTPRMCRRSPQQAAIAVPVAPVLHRLLVMSCALSHSTPCEVLPFRGCRAADAAAPGGQNLGSVTTTTAACERATHVTHPPKPVTPATKQGSTAWDVWTLRRADCHRQP